MRQNHVFGTLRKLTSCIQTTGSSSDTGILASTGRATYICAEQDIDHFHVTPP